MKGIFCNITTNNIFFPKMLLVKNQIKTSPRAIPILALITVHDYRPQIYSVQSLLISTKFAVKCLFLDKCYLYFQERTRFGFSFEVSCTFMSRRKAFGLYLCFIVRYDKAVVFRLISASSSIS